MNKNRLILFCVLAWGLPCGLLFAWAMEGSQGKGLWFWLSLSVPLWSLSAYAIAGVLHRRMTEHDQKHAGHVEVCHQAAAADERRDRG